MCTPKLHSCEAAGVDLERSEAGEPRPGQEVREEDEAARAREPEVREQLHSRLRQEDVEEDVQEERKKSGARGAFGGPWQQRPEGMGGTQKRMAEQAREEETEEKDVRVVGGARDLWQEPGAEQQPHPHHIHQPPAEAREKGEVSGARCWEHKVAPRAGTGPGAGKDQDVGPLAQMAS